MPLEHIKFQYIDDLYSIWMKERENSQTLTPIKSNFYADIKIITDKIAEIIRTEEDSLVKKVLTTRLNRIQYILKDLIELRSKKIALSVIENKKIEVNLAQEEYAFYSHLQKLYSYFIRSIEKPSEALAFQNYSFYELEEELDKELSEEEQKPQYLVIRFTNDVKNEIVGLDGAIYGPFKKEDVCKLPKENARIFIENDMAEKIEL